MVIAGWPAGWVMYGTGCVWGLLAEWWGGRLGMFRLTPGEVFVMAREGRLRLPSAANALQKAGLLLMLTSIVVWLVD